MDPQVIQRTEFSTAGGVRVTRTAEPFDPAVLDGITRQVDDRRGGVLSSGMEYPGRYSRWHLAYVDPCAEIVARGRRITVRALNDRGTVLLPVLERALLRAGELAAGSGLAAERRSGAGGSGGCPPGKHSGGSPPQACTVIIPEPAVRAGDRRSAARPLPAAGSPTRSSARSSTGSSTAPRWFSARTVIRRPRAVISAHGST